MRDAVGIALEARAYGVFLLRTAAAVGISGAHAEVTHQNFFQLFAFLPRTSHALRLPESKKSNAENLCITYIRHCPRFPLLFGEKIF